MAWAPWAANIQGGHTAHGSPRGKLWQVCVFGDAVALRAAHGWACRWARESTVCANITTAPRNSPFKIARLYPVSRAGRTKAVKDGESMATTRLMW